MAQEKRETIQDAVALAKEWMATKDVVRIIERGRVHPFWYVEDDLSRTLVYWEGEIFRWKREKGHHQQGWLAARMRQAIEKLNALVVILLLMTSFASAQDSGYINIKSVVVGHSHDTTGLVIRSNADSTQIIQPYYPGTYFPAESFNPCDGSYWPMVVTVTCREHTMHCRSCGMEIEKNQPFCYTVVVDDKDKNTKYADWIHIRCALRQVK